MPGPDVSAPRTSNAHRIQVPSPQAGQTDTVRSRIVCSAKICEPVDAVIWARAVSGTTARSGAGYTTVGLDRHQAAGRDRSAERQRRLLRFFTLLFLLPPRGSDALREALVSSLTWSCSSTE